MHTTTNLKDKTGKQIYFGGIIKLHYYTVYSSNSIIVDSAASTTLFKSEYEALTGSYTNGSKKAVQLVAENPSIDCFGQGTVYASRVAIKTVYMLMDFKER